MQKKLFLPAIALLNRLNYTRKFTLLWVLSLIAIAVVVYSLFAGLEQVIQPSQRQLQGIALIKPIFRTAELTQLHRGLSLALLGGNEAMRDRRAAKESEAAEAFKAMEGVLPPGLASNEDFRLIKASWERLRKEGLHWTTDENFAAHTRLIKQIQLFEVFVADEYLLILDPEIATFYLIDTAINKLPHALEYLGQLRAYGTMILARKRITEPQKTKLNSLVAELDSTLKELNYNLGKTARHNPTVRNSLLAVSNELSNSARQITGVVASDILAGHFAMPPDVFLNMATAEIDKGYAQMHEALLPTAEALIKARIARAKNTLHINLGVALLVFLVVVYFSVSMYYAIIDNIQSLVRSLRAFSDGDLRVRVKLDTHDELKQVGESFNEMAHEFGNLFEMHREGEARLHATIETAMDAVVQMDAGGTIIDWNDQAENIFGWSREEAVGQALHETIIPPQYREAHVNGLKRFLLTGEGPMLNSRIEITALHRDGREFPVELTIAQTKTGGKYEFSAFIRDIAERRQTQVLGQQRLDELEAIYLLSYAVSGMESLDQVYEEAMDCMLHLLKADRVAILLFDADGVMHFKAWRNLSDAYREALDGHSPWARDADDPQPVFVEDIELDARFVNFRQVIITEGMRALGFVPLARNGRLIGKFMVYFNTPHRFTESEIQLTLTIASHVSFAIDRKLAKQQFADIFEFAPDAIVITDQQGIITLANRQADKMFGYSHEELIGQPFDMLLPHDTHHKHLSLRQNLANVVMQGSVIQEPANTRYNDLRAIRKDGSILPVEISLSPMEGQNGMVIAAAVRDVSERQRALELLQTTANELEQANAQIEEERAQLATRVAERTAQLLYANRAKDSFLATMSHEIRTPLGGLLGMMELISLSRLDDSQREMLQAARNSGQSLLRIVNDILDWSKIEAGKLELSPQAATIPEIIKGVVSTYSSLASAKGLLLRQQIDSKLGAAHIFDPLRLSQILNNFTSNAIKFTGQGSVEIGAELIAQHEGAELVRFCVKDSGAGISPEQQANLFQFYEQASADTARMYGGTGLGLAICRNLAELMEGTVSVESTPGAGSTFCFMVSLPVASPAAQRDMVLRQAREDGSDENKPDITPLMKDGKPVSVLLVDDHPVNRKLLKQQLELLGMHAEDAAYGIVALSLWWTGRFDIVITDCHMPEMDGYELTRSIREMEQHDARQRIPIIAWTANVLAEEEERCRAAGMDDLLTKPTDLADLRAMLLKWLDKSPSPAGEGSRGDNVIDDSARDTPIDFSVLKKIAKSHAAQVEMLQEFDLCNRSDIANLNAALKEGNPAAVERSAHRIKGASRMVGALELEGICTAIEKAAMQRDMDGARAAAGTALDEAIARIEAAIGKFIGGK